MTWFRVGRTVRSTKTGLLGRIVEDLRQADAQQSTPSEKSFAVRWQDGTLDTKVFPRDVVQIVKAA
ncbi:MAG TPA: hypothetical protein VG713_16655 [Pirellulales bacterium]|nr:hypothetical protein [Pirellulales bacterium]